MSAGEHVPGIDPHTPSVARMYDFYLGGKDHFPADRQAAEKIVRLVPEITHIARANRDFLIRVVRVLVAAGIRQFVDIGTGLPTQQNVHEVALGAAADCRIAYVDNDPIVLTHARALLADNTRTIVVDADLRDPETITGHPEIRAHLDFDRPVAVLLFAILHFVPSDLEAAAIVARLRSAVAGGSYLAMSHSYAGDLSTETIRAGQAVYRSSSTGSIVPRGVDAVRSFFDGLDLLDPGVVPVDCWRPEWEEEHEPDFGRPGLLGAVARFPSAG
ncbi:SAM-dependent methyltransferase [Nonomuraea sp. NPDC050790]|uniref:SAM-dependent methyltransferase n=1 Tax=Nonomuraea sp. NPDC050790 TaxID=3364371 RepID=UPI0037B115A8